MVEARESQRELMKLAAMEEIPASGSSSTSNNIHDLEHRGFLDLSLRNNLQEHSTVTSLESLASSIDLRDDLSERNLKRNRDLIMTIDKASQVKEQRNSFFGLFPSGDTANGSPKKVRKDCD